MPRAKTAPAPEPESAQPEAKRQPDPSVWVFAGPYALTYPESRDAAGRGIGTVAPGDRRILVTAPDSRWRLATQAETGEWIETSRDAEGLRLLGFQPEREHPGFAAEMTGTEHPADGTLSPEISNDGSGETLPGAAS